MPVVVLLQSLHLLNDNDRVTYADSLFAPEELKVLGSVLRQNKDVFACTHSNMLGIHPSIASHWLNIMPSLRPIRHKVLCFHPDRQKIIQPNVDKLLAAKFIKEVEYPDWLVNVMVDPKKCEKWRVCVDYTNLNYACPKDSFLLPQIDQILDATTEHKMLSFIDAFSGYHQIPIFQPDEEKIVFVMSRGLYYYKVMPLGLKNIGATYKRLMTKIFKPLIGRIVKVYINDIVVKIKT